MAFGAIPPWLVPRGEDPAAAFVSAFHAGATVAAERARLQQESQMAGIKLQVQQQEQERETLRQQQNLEMAKAAKEAELGLKRNALEQAQEKINIAAQSAATKFAAQQKYTQLVQSGMDPSEAAMKVGPALFGTMAGFSTAAKNRYEQQHPFVPSGQIAHTLDAQGNPIPGLDVPVVMTGRNEARINPNAQAGKPNIQAANIRLRSALATKKELENDPLVGPWLTGAKDPPTKGDNLRKYTVAKKQYDAVLSAIQPQDQTQTPAQTPTAKKFIWDSNLGKTVPVDQTTSE